MRVAVISDIHGNLPALEAVLEDIAAASVDRVLNLGDTLAGPIDPLGVVNALMAANYPTVCGNHDRWVIDRSAKGHGAVDAFVLDKLNADQRAWLAALPATLVVDDIFMCHGTPASDEDPWLDSWWTGRTHDQFDEAHVTALANGLEYPVLLCGHTHMQRAVRLRDGRLIVNPGSVGLQFLHGMPDAHYAILDRHADGSWTADLRMIPYDREAAARAAEASGFPQWRDALMTGWPAPAGLF